MAANSTQITLTASNQTAAAFAQVNRALGGLKTSAASVLSSFGGLGSVLTVGGFVAFAKSTIDAADSMNDLATATGTSVESLASYKLAAKQSGTNVEGLAKGLGKLSVYMGKNADEAARLGITARDPVAAFAQLADTLSSVQDPAERNALAAKVLGKSYTELMPLLAQGGDSLRAQAAAAGPYAESMAKMAVQADKFNDALAKIGQSAAVSLLPLVSALAKVAEGFDNAASSQTSFLGGAALGVNIFNSAGQQLNDLREEIKDLEEQKQTASSLGLGEYKSIQFKIDKAKQLKAVLEEVQRNQALADNDRLGTANYKQPSGKTGGFEYIDEEALKSAESMQASLRKAFDIKPLDDFIASFGDRAQKIKQEYAKLAVDIGGKKEGPATGLDVSSDIGAAKGAIAGGDTLKADALVERAKAGLKDLASFEQSYYARQLQDIELGMNAAAQKTAEASRESLKAVMDKQAAELAKMDPIHVPIAAEAIANDLRATIDVIRKELANNPLIIPVQASGGTDIARAAAKVGAR